MTTNTSVAGRAPQQDVGGGHESVGGFCGVCGVVWPCPAARRAVLGLDRTTSPPPERPPTPLGRLTPNTSLLRGNVGGVEIGPETR